MALNNCLGSCPSICLSKLLFSFSLYEAQALWTTIVKLGTGMNNMGTNGRIDEL